SRRRLELEGEYEFSVAPLPVPAASGQRSVVSADKAAAEPASDHWLLAAVPSVQLFVDRAQAAEPHFQITPRNAEAVAELCRRLDGLPLAIELAAARASAMGPARMLAGLTQRFQFLTSSRRDLSSRHRSLWATLDWS